MREETVVEGIVVGHRKVSALENLIKGGGIQYAVRPYFQRLLVGGVDFG
jgi:hypothetical protein